MGGRNSALRAESYCDWWSLAGVDALVGEEPAGWLKLPVANDPKPKPKIVTENEPPPLPHALQRPAPVAAPTPKGPVTFPDDWNDQKSGVSGKSVSVRVVIVGRRLHKNKN